MLIIDKAGENLKQLCSKLEIYVTHTDIDNLMARSGIKDVSTKSVSLNGYGYIKGDNKINRLFKCFENELVTSQSDNKIICFIEAVSNPSRFNNDITKFSEYKNSINSILLLMGCELKDDGKLYAAVKATTIDEVQKRINILENEVRKRNIHPQVLKYCKREYLDKDYFHAQFEASKGLFQRIRDLINQNVDGTKIINGVFSTDEPMLILPNLNLINRTDKDEFLG